MSCRQNKVGNEGSMTGLAFPYQAYLDNMEENEYFPTIGNDGQGFDAISHNIVYPEMPDTLSLSLYADSLLQFYNMILAFNTMAYDVGTAERYMGESDFGLAQADALDSINLSGIKLPEVKELIQTIILPQNRTGSARKINPIKTLSEHGQQLKKKVFSGFQGQSSLGSAKRTDDAAGADTVSLSVSERGH